MQLLPNLSSGYSTFDPDTDIPADLKGKVVLITGANSGCGFSAAQQLASHGAKVYLGARSEERGTEAANTIKAQIAGLERAGSVQWLPADVSTPAGARATALGFLALENRLDILINNAGISPSYYKTVACGGGLEIEQTMATNHLGGFVLTKELTPLLEKTAKLPNSDVRIVALSSDIHSSVPAKTVNLRELQGWNLKGDSFFQRQARYNLSKLANILFIKELQRRFDASNLPISCIAIHPGLVKTTSVDGYIARSGIIGIIFGWIARHLGLSLEQGGYNTVFAATSPLVKEKPQVYNGAYLIPYGRVTTPSKLAQQEKLAADLWACSEEVVEICLGSA